MNTALVWMTEEIDITEINPAEYNPRKFTQEQFAELSKSIDRFNLADPLVINTDRTLIGGHFRLQVLKKKGVTKVSVRVPNRPLTKEEETELNLRLNKNTGDWDKKRLVKLDPLLLKDIGFTDQQIRIAEKQTDLAPLTQPDLHATLIFQMSFTDQQVVLDAFKKAGDQNKEQALLKICKAYLTAK